MQILIVTMVLPSLIILAATKFYTPIRLTGAVIAAVAALGWLADRLGLPNPLASTADRIGSIGLAVIIALAALALVTVLHRYRARPDKSDEPRQSIRV